MILPGSAWPWLLGFAVTATCWPGMEGTASLSRWAALSVILPLAMCWVRVRLTWPLVALLALISWAALSLIWTPILAYGVNEVWKWLLLAMAFMVGAGLADLKGLFRGMAVGIVPSAVLAFGQFVSAGTFGNPDLMGEAAALVLLGLLVTEARPLICAAPALCLAMSHARGALLAFGIAIVAAFKVRGLLLALAPLALMILLVVPASKNMLSTHSMMERSQIWTNTAKGITWLGQGAGSYVTIYPQLAPPEHVRSARPEHAHNDFLEFAFEYGGVGLILGAALLSLLIGSASLAVRYLLLAGAVEAAFGFPLHNPATAFVLAVVAGSASRAWAPLRLRELFGGAGLHRGSPGDILRQRIPAAD